MEDNLIVAIPHLTFITGMCIYTLQFRSSFPALWGIWCSSEWATSSSLWAQCECRLRSAGLCPHQSQLLVQAPLAGVWSDGAANVTVHQRNLRWLGEIWGLTWHTLHGWMRIIPSCLENIICFDQLWYLHGPVPRAGYLGYSSNEKQEKDLWSTANLMQVSKLVIPLWECMGSGEHLDLTEL